MNEAHNDDATRELMRALGDAVEVFLEGMTVDGDEPAFTLLLWPEGQPADRVNYVSNVPRTRRREIRDAMKAVQKRWRAAGHRKE